jgi:hypothetical protein
MQSQKPRGEVVPRPEAGYCYGEKGVPVRLLFEWGCRLCDHGCLVMPETTLQPSGRHHDAEDHKNAHWLPRFLCLVI